MRRLISDVWDSLTGDVTPYVDETPLDKGVYAIAITICLFIIAVSLETIFLL